MGCRKPKSSERGATLVHVAAALLALMAVSAVSIDYGMKWVSRRQAQNAADAAAMGGAISLALDDPNDFNKARTSAKATGESNWIYGKPPNIDPVADISFPPCPPGAPGVPDTCVRVNVYRNQQKNPLPTFFASLVGVASQGVRAMATAQVAAGKAANCVKPWAIPDKWFDNRDTTPPIDTVWTWDDEFERYFQNGPNKGQLLPNPQDVYIAPSSIGPGSGFRLPNDYGTQVVMKWGNPQNTIAAGWYFPVDLPGGCGTGGKCYEDTIATCSSAAVKIGDVLTNEPGGKVGPTVKGIRDLIALDPSAYWDGSSIQGSCVPACGSKSPRLIAVVSFDVDNYSIQDRTSGRFTVTIVNMFGLFLDGVSGNGNVTGYLMNYPGLLTQGMSNLTPESSFLRTVILVR